MKSFTAILVLAVATLTIAAPTPSPDHPVEEKKPVDLDSFPQTFQGQCDRGCTSLCSFGMIRATCPGDARDTIQCLCEVTGTVTTSRNPSN